MERSKKILNIAIAISIVLCSLSLFLYSVNSNKAIAQPLTVNNAPVVTPDGYTVIDVLYMTSSNGYNYIKVLGYNEKTNDIKVLKSIKSISLNQ
jgi:hypothetical protein